ncbi:hypothetical protein D3C71_1588140 [compost metagenome]
MKHQPAGDGTFVTAAAAAQCRGDQRVARLEQFVKTPQAAETGGKGHLTQRHIGIRQQAFGLQQPVRLGIINRRGAKLIGKNTPQVAIGNA